MFNAPFPLYPVFILLSLLSGFLVLNFNLRPLRLNREERVAFLALSLACALFGGKFFTALSSLLPALASHSHPASLNFLDLGLSSYGAIFGFLLSALFFSRLKPLPLSSLVSSLLPAALLMYSVGKIGCFLVGCCYGIEYSGPFAVTYSYSSVAPVGVKLFPVQLLETIVFFLLFLVFEYFFLRCSNKNRPKKSLTQDIKSVSALLVLSAALMKFLLDFLRTGHSYSSLLAVFSLNQLVSLALLVSTLVFLYKNRSTATSRS